VLGDEAGRTVWFMVAGKTAEPIKITTRVSRGACERIVAESPDRAERRAAASGISQILRPPRQLPNEQLDVGIRPGRGVKSYGEGPVMIWFLEDHREDVVLVVRAQHFELSDPAG
jgi:hypothetical protein